MLFDYYYKDSEFRVCPQATKVAAPDGATDTLTLGGDALTAWGIVAAERQPARRAPAAATASTAGSNQPADDPLYGKPAQFFWRTPNVKEARPGPAVPGLLVLVRLAG